METGKGIQFIWFMLGIFVLLMVFGKGGENCANGGFCPGGLLEDVGGNGGGIPEVDTWGE